MVDEHTPKGHTHTRSQEGKGAFSGMVPKLSAEAVFFWGLFFFFEVAGGDINQKSPAMGESEPQSSSTAEKTSNTDFEN